MADSSATTAAPSEADSSQSRLSPGGWRIDPAVLLRVGGGGCLAVVGWLSTGPVGLGVGVALALVSLRSRPAVTAALAQAGLVVVAPDIGTGRLLPATAAFELGVVALLLSERPVEPPTVVLTAAFGAVLVACVVSVLVWAGLLAASALLVCLTAVISYGVHRFERVSLGLVAESPAGAAASTDSTTTGSQ